MLYKINCISIYSEIFVYFIHAADNVTLLHFIHQRYHTNVLVPSTDIVYIYKHNKNVLVIVKESAFPQFVLNFQSINTVNIVSDMSEKLYVKTNT